MDHAKFLPNILYVYFFYIYGYCKYLIVYFKIHIIHIQLSQMIEI